MDNFIEWKETTPTHREKRAVTKIKKKKEKKISEDDVKKIISILLLYELAMDVCVCLGVFGWWWRLYWI